MGREMGPTWSSEYSVSLGEPFVSSGEGAHYTTLGLFDFLKTDIGTACFYVALVMWIFFGSIYYTSFFGIYLDGSPWRAIRFFCLLLLAFGEVVKGRHNIASIVFLAFVLITAVTLDDQYNGRLLDGMLFIYCARNQSFRTIAKVSLWVIVTTMVIVVASAFAGLITNYVSYSAARVRFYLGYRYALYPAMYAFVVTSLCVYLRRDSMRIIEALGLIIFNWLIYQATVSRLSFYLAIAVVLAVLLMKKTRGRVLLSKPLGTLAISSFAVCAAVILWITVNYSSSVTWMYDLNGASLLAGRFSLGQDALRTYGVSAFGQPITFVGNGLNPDGQRTVGTYNYVDSLYVLILVHYGWVFALGFVGLFTVVAWRAWKDRDPYLLLVLVFLALHGVLDDLMLWLNFDPFLLLIGSALVPSSWRKAGCRRAPVDADGGAVTCLPR